MAKKTNNLYSWIFFVPISVGVAFIVQLLYYYPTKYTLELLENINYYVFSKDYSSFFALLENISTLLVMPILTYFALLLVAYLIIPRKKMFTLSIYTVVIFFINIVYAIFLWKLISLEIIMNAPNWYPWVPLFSRILGLSVSFLLVFNLYKKESVNLQVLSSIND